MNYRQRLEAADQSASPTPVARIVCARCDHLCATLHASGEGPLLRSERPWREPAAMAQANRRGVRVPERAMPKASQSVLLAVPREERTWPIELALVEAENPSNDDMGEDRPLGKVETLEALLERVAVPHVECPKHGPLIVDEGILISVYRSGRRRVGLHPKNESPLR